MVLGDVRAAVAVHGLCQRRAGLRGAVGGGDAVRYDAKDAEAEGPIRSSTAPRSIYPSNYNL